MTGSFHALSSYALATEPLQHVIGQVVNLLQDGRLMVKGQRGGWPCRQAASCLLRPEMGDTVLLIKADEQYWILAILERAAQENPAEIHVTGDLSITAQGNLNLSSHDLTITADNGNCHINDMQYSGESLSAWISITKMIGNQLESVWQTITQLSQRLFRHTAQTEQVNAGQLNIQAENYIRLHAQNTIVSAKAITKIDAEQIHIG